MTTEEAAERLREALRLHLDAVADAIERGDELIEDRGQYDHARDIIRRLAATPGESADREN